MSRWILVLGGALIVAVAAIVAFYVSPVPTPPRTAAPPPQATENPAAPPSSAESPNSAGLTADFDQFQKGLHAKVGVVVRAAGSSPLAPVRLGTSEFADQPAWSTIKVPLVMAAMRQHHWDPPTSAMTAAITESDNAAAEAIWESLGDPSTAATAVGAVLHAAGDQTTVESRKVRPEFTAFGQTQWSLTSQATFLAAAACDPRNRPVLDLMGQVVSDQRAWGVGPLPGAEVKGGWGPSPSGRYIVRQIALLPTGPKGTVIIAMAAEPDSGSFTDGTQTLAQIGAWLRAHLGALPAATCRG